MGSSRRRFVFLGLAAFLLMGGLYWFFSSHSASLATPINITDASKTPLPSSPAPATQNPVGIVPTYHYNAQGQIELIAYPDGSTYTYQYDVYGDKIRETTTTGKTWSYVYDQNHHPVSVIDPEGKPTPVEAPKDTSNP